MGQFLLVLVVYWQHRLINKDINEGFINVGQQVYEYESSALTSMEEMKRALFEAKKTEKQL